jgi:dihydrodipicolinate synthase/N-acetylneuraminate lyase
VLVPPVSANRALHAHVSPLLDGLLAAGATGEFPSLSDDEEFAGFRAGLYLEEVS